MISDATVQRIGTNDPLVHFFRQQDGELGVRRQFTASRTATGLGDITVRIKGAVTNGLSLALDLRIPTGDEEDLLGSGAAGLAPFVIWSTSAGAFSPHVNVG